MGYILFFRSAALPSAGETAANFGAPDVLAQMLFSSYLLPFEVISILLLVAMVGAIVLTKRLKPKS
jgi:NADH-quinone oxidoreductase subunit J